MEPALKKSLQEEVLSAKKRWGDAVKLSKAPASSPTAPLPISVARTIPRPAAAEMFDVAELTVRLLVDGPAAAPGCLRVEVRGDSYPPVLLEAMAARVLSLWEGILTKYEIAPPAAGGPFAVERILAWCETKFVDLLNLDPTLIETYEGVNALGMTIRRFTLAEPKPTAEGKSEGSSERESEKKESDESSDGESDVEAERLMRIKLKAELEADRVYREERRKEHEEEHGGGQTGHSGGGDAGKAPKKKEKETAKEKQGTRLRKQGAKSSKFDAEAAGKKPNKKNGLVS